MYATTWMDLKAFMLNYINQIKKEDILYDLILEHSKKCKQI